jgi:hypothetical protein
LARGTAFRGKTASHSGTSRREYHASVRLRLRPSHRRVVRVEHRQPAVSSQPSLTAGVIARRAGVMPQQRAIEELIAEFRSAIARRDRARFLSLFLDPNRTSWQGVNGDRALETRRATDPSVVKVRSNPNSTPASFIESVASDTAASDEVFDNVRIGGDADTATVSLDYRFLSDGRVKNTGMEHWLLVRTEQGWRITAVTWSIETYTP